MKKNTLKIKEEIATFCWEMIEKYDLEYSDIFKIFNDLAYDTLFFTEKRERMLLEELRIEKLNGKNQSGF